jgi:hypothetical protein
MKTGRTGNQLVMRRRPGEPKWNSPWAFTHADDEEIRRILDNFDTMRTGHAGHRNGQMNASGQPLIRGKNAPPKPVRSRELRLWPPPARRAPVRMVRNEPDPLEVDNLAPDYIAIEAERHIIDSRLDQTPNVVHASHNARRIAERQPTLPTVSSTVLLGVLAVLYEPIRGLVLTVVLVKDSRTEQYSSTAARAIH